MAKNEHIDLNSLSNFQKLMLDFRLGKIQVKGKDYTANERPSFKASWRKKPNVPTARALFRIIPLSM